MASATKNVLIVGLKNSGKTTLMRKMLTEMPEITFHDGEFVGTPDAVCACVDLHEHDDSKENYSKTVEWCEANLSKNIPRFLVYTKLDYEDGWVYPEFPEACEDPDGSLSEWARTISHPDINFEQACALSARSDYRLWALPDMLEFYLDE